MNNINRLLYVVFLTGVLAAAGCAGGGSTGGSTGGSGGMSSPAPAPAVLTVDGTSAGFGDVAVGNSRVLEATFSNSGQSPLTLQQISVSGSSFMASGVGAGVTLPPSQYVTLSISFTPSVTGTASGMVSLASSTLSSPINFSLSGNGVDDARSAALSWNPSASVVIGYNVYRASALNLPWTKLNSSPVTTTSYTDWDVQSGESYSYAVASVNASNFESPVSAAAPVTIPQP